MDEAKLQFIKNFPVALRSAQEMAPANWGKMNVQQMVEHVSDFFDVSSGKISFELVTPESELFKYRSFLFSDKQFRENTKAPENIVGEQPADLRYESLKIAIDHLGEAIDDFINYFREHPQNTTSHPVFGPLHFDEWVLLHYKHVLHHSRQFAIGN